MSGDVPNNRGKVVVITHANDVRGSTPEFAGDSLAELVRGVLLGPAENADRVTVANTQQRMAMHGVTRHDRGFDIGSFELPHDGVNGKPGLLFGQMNGIG